MSVSSMTGFARVEGQQGPVAWTWEVRSVNGRGLDVRCKLAAGFDALDPFVREAVGKAFKRGNVSIGLAVSRTAVAPVVRINHELLEQLTDVVRRLHQRFHDTEPPRLDTLLTVKGVVETVEEDFADEDARDAVLTAMQGDLGKALAALAGMRAAEGARLAAILSAQIDEIDRLVGQAEACAAARPEAARARLRTLVETLLAASPALPEERLAQEAALLAAKADVREEIDRLKAHVAAAREMVAAGGAVGRKLDFLCQEFNREANTLCSKAADVELTRIGLELKVVIEQLREQVQNVE